MADKKEPAPKPMNSIERKALKEIIDGDFTVLRSEVKVYAGELTAAQQRRIEAEYVEADALCTQAEIEWNQLRRELTDRADRFFQEKRQLGLGVSIANNYRSTSDAFSASPVTFTPRAKTSAISSIKNDVDHQVMKALNELDRQRLAMQREVLLTGLVTGGAKDLLDKMPDSRQVLFDALQENPRLAAIQAVATQQVEGRHAIEAPVEARIHIPEVVENE